MSTTTIHARPAISRNQLREAFLVFDQASRQLAGSYEELQSQVARLGSELAAANQHLQRQVTEKGALAERLSLLLAALPGGVVVLDGEMRVVEVNAVARELLREPVPGQPWREVSDRALQPTETPHEWTVAADNGPLRLSLSSRTLESGGGRIVLLSDVSEAHARRRELARHQRLAAIGQMSANLAHQLRTPLATALLYTSQLASGALPVAEGPGFAGKVLEQLRDLERFTQEMLRFARGADASDSEFAVAEVLSEVHQIMEPQACERGVCLRLAAPASHLRILACKTALTGALLTLIDNALRASGGGDTVDLAARAAGTAMHFVVRDHGCGMTADVKSRLFEPYFTTRGDGHGLGLAFVRSVALAHGGDVLVASAPGAGSEFVLILPVCLPTHGREEPECMRS